MIIYRQKVLAGVGPISTRTSRPKAVTKAGPSPRVPVRNRLFKPEIFPLKLT